MLMLSGTFLIHTDSIRTPPLFVHCACLGLRHRRVALVVVFAGRSFSDHHRLFDWMNRGGGGKSDSSPRAQAPTEHTS